LAFDFELPDVGEGIHEGEIVNWLVGEGDPVAEDEDIVEVMTDKATVQISAPVAGTIAELRFDEGDVVEVGEIFVVIEPSGDVDTEPQPSDETEPETARADPEPAPSPTGTNGHQPQRTPEGILAPPSVRIEARKRGIDIADVEGTGPAGRISMEDLEAHASTEPAGEATPEPTAEPTRATGAGGVAEALPYDIEPGSVDRETARAVEPIQAATASPSAHAARATSLQSHFTHAVQIDADELVEGVRAAGQEDLGEDTLVTAFVVKAIARGLRDHERCNAWVDEDSRDLVVADPINVGVATPTEDGLALRTVADADERGVLSIAGAIADGGDDAEATFTVTSYAGNGGLVATPILVHPQMAGASIGRIRDVARLDEGDVVPGKQLSLAFTFDHRYIDGYDGALLADDVEELLSSPGSMLLG
jgi:pyruvate dehydrogenase E2 component (dihydrolipoamide acetyltransferase)